MQPVARSNQRSVSKVEIYLEYCEMNIISLELQYTVCALSDTQPRGISVLWSCPLLSESHFLQRLDRSSSLFIPVVRGSPERAQDSGITDQAAELENAIVHFPPQQFGLSLSGPVFVCCAQYFVLCMSAMLISFTFRHISGVYDIRACSPDNVAHATTVFI